MTFERVHSPDENDRSRPFFFVVFTRCAPWDVLLAGGDEIVTEPRWECLALPGNLVGCGSTQEEAFEHLEKTLKFSIGRTESPKDWWTRAMNELTKDKAALFSYGWEKVLREARSEEIDGKIFGRLAFDEAPRELRQSAGVG